MRVFLAGVSAGNPWHEDLTHMLDDLNIQYFTPITDGSLTERIHEEDYEKYSRCDICLFLFTGCGGNYYDVAELVDATYRARGEAILAIHDQQMPRAVSRTLRAVGELVARRGARVVANACRSKLLGEICRTLEDIRDMTDPPNFLDVHARLIAAMGYPVDWTELGSPDTPGQRVIDVARLIDVHYKHLVEVLPVSVIRRGRQESMNTIREEAER